MPVEKPPCVPDVHCIGVRALSRDLRVISRLVMACNSLSSGWAFNILFYNEYLSRNFTMPRRGDLLIPSIQNLQILILLNWSIVRDIDHPQLLALIYEDGPTLQSKKCSKH